MVLTTLSNGMSYSCVCNFSSEKSGVQWENDYRNIILEMNNRRNTGWNLSPCLPVYEWSDLIGLFPGSEGATSSWGCSWPCVLLAPEPEWPVEGVVLWNLDGVALRVEVVELHVAALQSLTCKLYLPGLITNSILFCWLFTIKDLCKKWFFKNAYTQDPL